MERVGMKPKEAAKYLDLSVHTLNNWRVKGKGPRFIKFGRVIRYPIPELDAWKEENLHTGTNVKVTRTP